MWKVSGSSGGGIRSSERGSGTGALRNPSDRSGIRVFPADSVPPWADRTPWAEHISVSFPPTRLGEEPLPSPARGEGKHIEIVDKFPPPRRGRARVGVILGNFSHLQGGDRGFVLGFFVKIPPPPLFLQRGDSYLRTRT